MPGPRPLVTLLTDFGTADGYVGEVKGALLMAVPEVDIVDISHDVAPQDVESGRLALARYWRRFPPGTVHLVVVDPGVGADRAAIAVEAPATGWWGRTTGCCRLRCSCLGPAPWPWLCRRMLRRPFMAGTSSRPQQRR